MAAFLTSEFEWHRPSKTFTQSVTKLDIHPFHDLGQGRQGLILVNDYSDTGVFEIQTHFSDPNSKKVTVVLTAQVTGRWFDQMRVVITDVTQDWFK